MTYTLVLLRHGESEWNAKNLFTGWVDVELSDKGSAEAVAGGEQLKKAGLLPDVVHTSLLRRAINTANAARILGESGLSLVIEAINHFDIPGFMLTRTSHVMALLDVIVAGLA